MAKYHRPTRAEKHASGSPTPRFACRICGMGKGSEYARKQHERECNADDPQ